MTRVDSDGWIVTNERPAITIINSSARVHVNVWKVPLNISYIDIYVGLRYTHVHRQYMRACTLREMGSDEQLSPSNERECAAKRDLTAKTCRSVIRPCLSFAQCLSVLFPQCSDRHSLFFLPLLLSLSLSLFSQRSFSFAMFHDCVRRSLANPSIDLRHDSTIFCNSLALLCVLIMRSSFSDSSTVRKHRRTIKFKTK